MFKLIFMYYALFRKEHIALLLYNIKAKTIGGIVNLQ